MIGAVVIGALARLPRVVVPVLGEIHSWQLVFVAVGLPGLLIALLMRSVPEPVRRDTRTRAPGTLAVAAYLCRHWRLYAPMFVGVALSGIDSGGSLMWRPAFFQRTYGWSPQLSGLATGLAQLIASPVGLFLGAFLAEWLARRHDDANLRVVALAWIVATPLIVAGPLMPTADLAVICSGLAVMAAMMAAPTQNAAVQSVTPGEMRGQVTALYLLTYVLAGNGIGPSLVAAVTVHVVGAESGLRYALAGTGLVMMPLAAVTMLLGLRRYGQEIGRLRRMG